MGEFERSEFITTTDGGNIYGLLYKPLSALEGRRCPMVLYAPGISSNHLSGDRYARELASRGYAVCCIDFRGGCNSMSDGYPLDMTLFTEQDDLAAVYDSIVRQPFVDANNVFLMGASMGGAVAALVAGARPNLMKGLILLYPAFSLSTEVEHAYPDPVKIPESAEFGGVTVGGQFLRTLYGFNIYMAASSYRGPVLILHGTDDDVVPSNCSVRATRTYQHARLELISGAKHGFSGGAFKYATRVIVGFLDEECDLADESGLEGDLNFKGGIGL